VRCSSSPAYEEFVGRYAKNGVIPNAVKGVQSHPFRPTQGAAHRRVGHLGRRCVRNDLYAPITDLVGERELTVADLVTRAARVRHGRVRPRDGKTNNAAPSLRRRRLPAPPRAPSPARR
jgi:hypothetical protein